MKEEPGDFARQLLSKYGLDVAFEPTPCWTVILNKPKKVFICRLRNADNGKTADYADLCTKGGDRFMTGSTTTLYLFSRKPKLEQMQDEYGLFRQWIAVFSGEHKKAVQVTVTEVKPS